jgi:hypothetical protein
VLAQNYRINRFNRWLGAEADVNAAQQRRILPSDPVSRATSNASCLRRTSPA